MTYITTINAEFHLQNGPPELDDGVYWATHVYTGKRTITIELDDAGDPEAHAEQMEYLHQIVDWLGGTR